MFISNKFCHQWLFKQFSLLEISFFFNSRKFCSTSTTHKDATRSSFRPSMKQLGNADKLFQAIGPRAVLQGSSLKITDTEKLELLPEIAFVGRTSVGKSSLINAILHQKKLARTSKKPGHTRLINFFNIGSKFYLVDLPGYGYVEGLGYGSKHFVKVVENYLRKRTGKQLRSVCLLVDGKVGVKKNDLIAIEMLEELNTPYQVVVTKMDRVNKMAHFFVRAEVSKVLDQHTTICYPHVFQVSSKEKAGLSALRCFICLNVGALE